jgi:D-tyrosyl-tRNA(Tyr) deacylase
MRVVVQRVKMAHVSADSTRQSRINKGMLLLVGIGKNDTTDDIERLAKKIANLRIFDDQDGRMNLNIHQVKGEILSVPQFTLYADTRKGNRPGFEQTSDPVTAERYWRLFNQILKENNIIVKEGFFGAHMDVELVNDGPVTIWLDSKDYV